MKSVYPRTKINLVERPEWKEYDPADKLGNTIFENAASLVDSLSQKGVGAFAEAVMGRTLDEEDQVLIWEAYQSRDPRLEEFQQVLMEAASWSMEEAFTPLDKDIDFAIKRALEELPQDDVNWLDEFAFKSLQDVMLSLPVQSPVELVKGLLSGIAWLERKRGHYDRFLVYDPEASGYLRELKALPLQAAERGVLDWIPPTRMYNQAIAADLHRFYDMMKEHVVERTFRELGKRMEGVDYDSRVDFWPMVKKRVEIDPKERKRVQKALREVLSERPAQMGANPFFSSSPRSRRLARDYEEMKELVRESSILEIKQVEGDPPDRYIILFKGNGLSPEGKLKKNHEILIHLGMNYPSALPGIQWITPIKHPNISGNGSPCLGNIGMNPRVRLVDIVEVLWDMNRMASYSAGTGERSYEDLRKKYGFPVDERILRDKAPRPEPGDGGEELIILGGY